MHPNVGSIKEAVYASTCPSVSQAYIHLGGSLEDEYSNWGNSIVR